MHARTLQVGLSSPADRANVVADLMVDNVQLAEVNVDSGEAVVAFYPRPDGLPWRVQVEALRHALDGALDRLGAG